MMGNALPTSLGASWSGRAYRSRRTSTDPGGRRLESDTQELQMHKWSAYLSVLQSVCLVLFSLLGHEFARGVFAYRGGHCSLV